MWIRSQDGTALVDANQLMINHNKIVCNKWILGTFDTGARALEVLDEIQNHLNDYKNGYREVYEMPQE